MNLKSYLIALAVALVLGAWMVSGQFADEPVAQTEESASAAAPMTVEVVEVSARPVQRFIESEGDTEADQDVQLRAETAGRVSAVRVEQGERVAAGDTLLTLAMGDRQARLAEAEARVAQRQADLDAAEQLQRDGYQSEIAVREARAALESARAQLAAIREDIANTTVTAPIDGLLQSRAVDVGDYVRVGDALARLMTTDPLVAVAHVAQQDIRQIELGRPAELTLATGDRLTGRVRYISAAAEAGSKTFRVEVHADNPQGLPVGVSATIRIPLGAARGHFLSPAWLSLNEAGEMGVKTLDEDNRVVFRAVEVIRTQRDGVWVAGLPDSIRLITVGQGFVQAGEQVDPVMAEQPATEP
ncbi:efflux RND transporter periplasmic adaptor subunit [Spiribacter pallidus]|jgi:multidrug efflux system membrane fusion protein|uniref:Efflux RND transporter periplasmic adaptor subunit n=1 Tax=Spiribacter pallidus TaxID=1987936 RepID=A0ABV3TC70_9GAMM